MKNIKFWEPPMSNQYIYFYNIKDYTSYLLSYNKSMIFKLKNKYSPSELDNDSLENLAKKENIELLYTDLNHPIAISKSGSYKSYLDPIFFQNHKEEFIATAKELFKKSLYDEYSSIQIQDFIFTEELLEKIINDDKLKYKNINYYLIEGKNLTDNQIKKIQDNHLEFTIIDTENKKISTKYLLGKYTMAHLNQLDKIVLEVPIRDIKLENLIYLNNNATIHLEDKCTREYGEKEYFNQVKSILNILKKHNKKYKVNISIKNRELFRQSKLIEELPNNIELFIANDFSIYTMQEYLKEEEQLENLIKDIRESNLSPLEKYLSVYNIVKKYKKYKENSSNPNEARYIKNILDNEYIVCVGFSKLLCDLLNRVAISNMDLSVQVDTSYDNGFTQEEIPVKAEGHARCLVKISDKKYNINGIYIADPTWDNNLESDIYLNALLTFDNKKEAQRLEYLTKEDFLLDFHNSDEFNYKINFFINNLLRKNKVNTIDKEKEDRSIYEVIFSEIMEILFNLDTNLYKEFYKKYINIVENKDVSSKEINKLFYDMLNEYSNYIIPLVNNNIDLDTILHAVKESKKTLENLNEVELNNWYETTKNINLQEKNIYFPYIYDTSTRKEAYLETYNASKKQF